MNKAMPAMAQDRTVSLVATWAVLACLTLMSWWLRDRGLGPELAAMAILVVAFLKVFVVGNSFMEIGHSAWQLRAAFTAWCVATCSVLVVLSYAL